jgi:glycerol-3-phosphate dehydrogenase (NAD(P)+)
VPIKDEIGGQILGAFKNIIAIGMGIIYELYNSSNTRAAMLSQGTKEIINIAKILGGNVNTLYEFCGIGDIYLTCTDVKSRNFLLGKMIVKDGIDYALQHFNKTVEGYTATEIAYDIIKKHKLFSPLISEIYKILYEKQNCKLIVKNVMEKL